MSRHAVSQANRARVSGYARFVARKGTKPRTNRGENQITTWRRRAPEAADGVLRRKLPRITAEQRPHGNNAGFPQCNAYAHRHIGRLLY